jgi:type IV pilus assembly protein PilN
MIRINLLTVARAKKKSAAPFLAAQKLTVACTLILIAAVLGVGWWYLTLNRESVKLDTDIAAAQQETMRLHSIIQQVQQFEQRRAQLEQRVVLIEQLRKGQTGPVHLLDQVSRAMPPMLWLTELKETEKTPTEVLIAGRSTTLTGVSDFVKNLEESGYFKRSIDIVNTTTEAISQPPGELIKFELKADFQAPEPPKPPKLPAPAKPSV